MSGSYFDLNAIDNKIVDFVSEMPTFIRRLFKVCSFIRSSSYNKAAVLKAPTNIAATETKLETDSSEMPVMP